jgi:hypothetical protein
MRYRNLSGIIEHVCRQQCSGSGLDLYPAWQKKELWKIFLNVEFAWFNFFKDFFSSSWKAGCFS